MKLLNDSELFVEQATWFAQHLPQPTMGAFACWLAPFMRNSSKRALESIVRLNHPAQIAAESAIAALLESPITQSAVRYSDGTACTRHVDWAETLTRTHPFSPTRFVLATQMNVLDRGTLSGLATIARQWAYLLVEYAGYTEFHERVTRLKMAARPFGSGAFTLAHFRRLARAPGEIGKHAQILKPALKLVSRPLTDKESVIALSGLREQMTEAGRGELDNCDDALEVSVILSIARGAEAGGWRVVSATSRGGTRKPILELQRGDMRCRIAKGHFSSPTDPKWQPVDALAEVQRHALGLASGRRQPDVVIGFWRMSAPENVLYCIADAKRNVAGDGSAYLKESVTSMAGYVVAYSSALRATLSVERGGFASPLAPLCTIFHVGESIQAPGSARKLTWLSTLDRMSYARQVGGVLSSTATTEWFDSISAQAWAHLLTDSP